MILDIILGLGLILAVLPGALLIAVTYWLGRDDRREQRTSEID